MVRSKSSSGPLCEGEMRDASDKAVDHELRRSLRTAYAKARLQRIRAEQLLVDVKQIWMSIPGMLATRCTGQSSCA